MKEVDAKLGGGLCNEQSQHPDSQESVDTVEGRRAMNVNIKVSEVFRAVVCNNAKHCVHITSDLKVKR